MQQWADHPLGEPQYWPPALRSTLNLVLNSGASTFFTWGRDYRFFYNDGYTPTLSGKPHQLGCPMRTLFHEAWHLVEPLLEAAMQGRTTCREDFEAAIERDGVLQEAWWSFSYSPIHGEDGAIEGVLCTVFEKTRRVIAERALRKSEEELRSFSDLVPGMLWHLDGKGRFAWVNSRARQIFDRDPCDEDMHDLNWIHPDDKEDLVRHWHAAERDRRSFEHKHRVRVADGSYRWMLSRAEPSASPSGDDVAWCGITTDVHDEMTAVDALRTTEARFLGFATNSTSLLWVAQADSAEIEYLSPACETIWGKLPEGQVFDWDYWLSTVHPDDRAGLESVQERLAAGEILQIEYRIVRPDAGVRWINETMFPIWGEDGKIRKIGGIARDITRTGRMLVHVVGTDGARQRALSERLERAGYAVRCFAAVNAFLGAAPALLPGCVVLHEDCDHADVDRVAATLRTEASRLPLILMSETEDVPRAVAIMRAGVRDLISPRLDDDRLERAVAAALAGLHDPQGAQDDAASAARTKLRSLSERERQILKQVAVGATSKEIGRNLGISPRTVETYRLRIVERLGVANLAEAIKLSAVAGL